MPNPARAGEPGGRADRPGSAHGSTDRAWAGAAMKAAVFKGIEDMQVEDVAEPEAGPRDVVVSVAACGICGSDLHTYLHGSFVQPGQVMGHEFAGEVIEAGDEVRGLAV